MGLRIRRRVLVQAPVQPAAIICKIEYPEPISEQEKAEILREHPGCHFPDFSAEQEYIVDPAGLTHWQFLPLSTETQQEGVTGPIRKENLKSGTKVTKGF